MPSRTVDRQRCLKRGCILTCYVDGRKRFRALSLDTAVTPDKPRFETDRSDSTPSDRRFSEGV
ncbi:MAG: hypothetical protein HS101_02820 [Planctomycetia bacterium]|jgi:hypothetical protein|nr:hypothetical protein [Planctomycetia bacterium]MCC7313806.1 hypothetical protein [Planctomycetota bacterium]OQZ06944.1 MAG: hypothetical protein B6D36_02405 [Planctomycetes bacterium UTPLA1]